jgi:SWI/SNF-related matrix-associated actin-dependent regulator of chromatin subfamily A3
MLEVDSKLKASNKTLAKEHCTFKVENATTDSGTEVVLKFQDNIDFGHLNIHASKALKGLIGRPSLQIDAIGAIQTICETIGRATKQADATVRVDMYMYGLRKDAEYIGQHLSGNKVFLQRPDRQRPNTSYENPQELKCPDIQLSATDYQMNVANQRLLSSQDAESFGKTISDVYASLKRGTNLGKVEGDRRLVTKLLP